jgi:inhibitor of cysteine peptidase
MTIGRALLLALAVLLTLLTTLFLVGDNPTSWKPATVEVSYADAGSTLQLHAGDTLLVTLEGNPSTGYAWEIAPGDTGVLKPAGEPQFLPESTALGSAGRVTLRFEAVAAGRTALSLVYRRPFEKDAPPLKTFEVTLEVGR